MDGTFAVLTAVFGLWEMMDEHCPQDGCLAPGRGDGAIAVSLGDVLFDAQSVGREAYVRHDTGRFYGPFEIIYGVSVSDNGAAWAGIGGAVDVTDNDERFFVELHTMAGLYAVGSGVDLGGPVEFRSGVEVGYKLASGMKFGLSYDHRSNADIFPENPGVETLQVRVHIPFD